MRPRSASLLELFPSKRAEDGCPLCVICGARITRQDGKPSHHSRRYCSEVCRDDAYVRSGTTWKIRELLWAKDRGVCALCGLDTGKIADIRTTAKRLGASALRHETEWWSAPADLKGLASRADTLFSEICERAHGRLWDLYGNPPWEADHIVPVAEGGGGCGVDGYRTLCRACHVQETAALARRLARARREEKVRAAAAKYGRPPRQLALW